MDTQLHGDFTRIDAIVSDRLAIIFGLFANRGALMYGEAVTEETHAVQCALAARQHGAGRALVVATLLHDVGHLLHDRGEHIADQGVDMHHEVLGEKFLRKYFTPDVSRPVGLHVDAKRYLCTVEPEYLAGLSPASLQSLHLQGGPMTPDEVSRFEANPHFRDAVLLRRCDEEGKRTDLGIPPVADFADDIAAELREAISHDCVPQS